MGSKAINYFNTLYFSVKVTGMLINFAEIPVKGATIHFWGQENSFLPIRGINVDIWGTL